MPKCPTCENDASSPNYRKETVEPKSDRDGVTVTAATGQQYWMICCPNCDAILGTVRSR
jgi:hypothetical protein